MAERAAEETMDAQLQEGIGGVTLDEADLLDEAGEELLLHAGSDDDFMEIEQEGAAEPPQLSGGDLSGAPATPACSQERHADPGSLPSTPGSRERPAGYEQASRNAKRRARKKGVLRALRAQKGKAILSPQQQRLRRGGGQASPATPSTSRGASATGCQEQLDRARQFLDETQRRMDAQAQEPPGMTLYERGLWVRHRMRLRELEAGQVPNPPERAGAVARRLARAFEDSST